MSAKFSEDIIPISDLKVNPGKVVRHTSDSHRPVLLTSRGRGIAVIQSVQDYETATEEVAFLKGIVRGLVDLQEGREVSMVDAKKRLKLK